MPLIPSFHEVRFPTDIALGSVGGPLRRTEVVTLGSGREQRNARWSNSRRRYNVGYGVKTLDDLSNVITFFEERRGRLFGFRYRDPVDNKSCRPATTIQATDQLIGVGDGATDIFQLSKGYGSTEFEWRRKVTKPVDGSVRVAVDGMLLNEGQDYEIDHASGEINFLAGHIPAANMPIYAGFEFDVPVRFDTDEISVNMTHFLAGDIAAIPLMEILA